MEKMAIEPRRLAENSPRVVAVRWQRTKRAAPTLENHKGGGSPVSSYSSAARDRVKVGPPWPIDWVIGSEPVRHLRESKAEVRRCLTPSRHLDHAVAHAVLSPDVLAMHSR